jgi:hypothetical protein
MSPKQKDEKIAKVSHLIAKYYDDWSLTSPKKVVSRISRILKPNQWRRVEDANYGAYDYDKPIKYSQKISSKPI